MARPKESGLRYYSMDVDFLQDIKVRKIMRACGVQSITVLISLLSSIYRDEGYYVVWDSDIPFLVADEVGTSEGAVTEIVNKALQVDFFNEKLFKKYNILTSSGIQKRYIEGTRKRKEVTFLKEYLLLGIKDVENLVNVYINRVNGSSNEQSKEKVKKSKEKESKVKQYVDDVYLNDALLDFIAHRKANKSPMTDKAIELFINRLTKEFGSVEERVNAINIAIERGWKSVKREWIDNVNSNNKPSDNGFYGAADAWAEMTTGGGK